MTIKFTSRRFFTIVLLLGLFLVTSSLPSLGQNAPKNLALIYTNNIGAEIDPCPV
jgi:hypothetical protein